MMMLVVVGMYLPASCTEDSTVQMKGFLAGGIWLLSFLALGFLMWEALEGKRIAEKEFLKEN
jgi:hypothetical protein